MISRSVSLISRHHRSGEDRGPSIVQSIDSNKRSSRVPGHRSSDGQSLRHEPRRTDVVRLYLLTSQSLRDW